MFDLKHIKLAIKRIRFGLLLQLHIHNEPYRFHAVYRYKSPDTCRYKKRFGIPDPGIPEEEKPLYLILTQTIQYIY